MLTTSLLFTDHKGKGNGTRLNDPIFVVTTTVGVEASGCEQLAHSRYVYTVAR